MADTILSQNEIDYLNTQRISRIATVSIISDRPIQPDIVPVGFDFDGEYIYVSGMNILNLQNIKIF